MALLGWQLALAGPAVAAPPAPHLPVAARPDTTLLVLSAASLADVAPALAERWSATSGVPVRVSVDATSRLAQQAVRRSDADVFLSADEAWIRWLEERGAVEPGRAVRFAGNALVVAVRAEQERDLVTPQDLLGLPRVALAGENVPAGRYAEAALRRAGVWEALRPRVVRAGSVRGALEWLARGEVPAAVVYRTDVLAEARVREAMELEGPDGPVGYWAAPLRTSDAPELAASFVASLTTPEAAAVLRSAGFVPAAPGTEPGSVPYPEAGSSIRAASPPPSPGASTVSVRSAIVRSLVVALWATLLGFVPAVCLGWVLARREFRGKTLLSTVVMIPLVLPPVVTGFLLLTALGSGSPLGNALARMGLPVPFTLAGAALAALVVGAPLYVMAARGAFEAVDPHFEEVSWTLGLSPGRTFLRVTLPLALPGIVAGAVLAFARALGEFGATVVLAGNVEGETRTIALAVYTLLESPGGERAIWLLVAASVTISLLALAGYELLSRRQRVRLEDRGGR